MPTWRAASGAAGAAVCPGQGGGGGETPGPYRSCNAVQWAQRKPGQCWQTVTLSDPYWNSQHNNSNDSDELSYDD